VVSPAGLACHGGTASLEDELRNEGFHNLARWSRGVDTALFHPRPERPFVDQVPIFLYVGRVAVEKNVEAFLNLALPGTKYVVGDGPQLDQLKGSYPDVRFVGFKSGEALAKYYAAADVFVFPSLTDTFGLTMLEALASCVPIAAFPVQGPCDVLLDDRVGCLNEDLKAAAMKALSLDRTACREYAQRYSWEVCTRQFLSYLTSARRSCIRTVTGRSPSSCGQRPS
jgi:1,2-diacylglycerol 3-alpha-glucosyltransferase/glucuronosyltransferase